MAKQTNIERWSTVERYSGYDFLVYDPQDDNWCPPVDVAKTRGGTGTDKVGARRRSLLTSCVSATFRKLPEYMNDGRRIPKYVHAQFARVEECERLEAEARNTPPPTTNDDDPAQQQELISGRSPSNNYVWIGDQYVPIEDLI